MIDTNVWVSALLNPSGAPAQLLRAFASGAYRAVTSEPLLAELEDVLRRPRIARKYGITAADVREFVLLLRSRATVVTVTGRFQACRDPKDNVVIETAIVGNAEILVSRDDDLKGDPVLLAALDLLDVKVQTVRHFLSSLEGEQ